MTKALPFTQASMRRAILAVESAGKRVVGVRPDGTLLVDNGDAGSIAANLLGRAATERSKWEDVEA